MNKSSWSPEEREDYEALLDSIVSQHSTTHSRGVAFVDALHSALSQKLMWARDVQREAELQFGENECKDYVKRNRVAVTYQGKVINKPRAIGVQRVQSSGKAAFEQALFDFFTWDELEAKAAEYLKAIAANKQNLHVVVRLLELREAVPGAINPVQACSTLGTTVEEWLAA